MTADNIIRWAFPAIAFLGVLVEVIAGPLILGAIRYQTSPAATTQYIGGELVTAAAALVMMVSAFYEKNSFVTLLGLGASLYIVYTMISVVFGQDYHRYDGNVEHWFLLFVVITLTTIPVAARKVSLLLHAKTPDIRWLHRGTLIAFGALFAVMWLSAIARNMQTPSPEYLADPTLFWLIKFLDLAVVVPVALICAAQWTGSYRTGGLMVLAFAFWILLAIAGMQIAVTVGEGGRKDHLIMIMIFIVAGWWNGYCLWLASRNWRLDPI